MIIWRGYGWVVAAIIAASLLIVNLSLDYIVNDTFYETHVWPKALALAISSVIIGYVGYILNLKNREEVDDANLKNETPSSLHTFFFIPIQYWSVIIPLIAIGFFYSSLEKDSQDLAKIQSPMVSDLYTVNYNVIYKDYEGKFDYGLMKVKSVNDDIVVLTASQYVYSLESGVEKSIEKGQVKSSDFSDDEYSFTVSELVKLKDINGITSVTR